MWSQLAYEGGGPGRFIRAGSEFVDASRVDPNVPVVAGGGYDGQFYYRLALDPLTSARTADGITFDRPAYRQQRILYPALAWVVARGDADAVPAALIAVNIAALGLLGWIGGGCARRLGRHAAWGLLFALYPGVLVTLSHDTTELVGASLLLASLLAVQSGRQLVGAAMLTLALFGRETGLVVAGTVLLLYAASWIRRRTPQPGALGFGAPIVAALTWQAVLGARWGRSPLGEANSLDLPFVGLMAAAWRNANIPADEAAVWAALLAVLAILIVVTLGSLRRTAAAPVVRVAWLFYIALAVFYEGNIWSNGAGYLRALNELAVLGTIIVLGSGLAARAVAGGALVAGTIVLLISRLLA